MDNGEPIIVIVHKGAYWQAIYKNKDVVPDETTKPFAPDKLHYFGLPRELCLAHRLNMEVPVASQSAMKDTLIYDLFEKVKAIGTESGMRVVLLDTPLKITPITMEETTKCHPQYGLINTVLVGYQLVTRAQAMFLDNMV